MVLVAGMAGCGNGAHPSRGPNGSGSSPAVSTGSASPSAQRTGLLYAEKVATFSSIWAVEHGCPVNLYIDFTDTGPRLRNPDTDGDGTAANGTAWPRLKWNPPCRGLTQEIGFDPETVAKVSGSPTQSSCQASVEQSHRDGSALRGSRLSDLAAGDEFCEDYKPVDDAGRPLHRVILLRVTSVSASNPIQVTWSVTDWALPSSPAAPPSAGGPRYTDQTFVMGDRKDCVPASVNLGAASGPNVDYGLNDTEGDVVYFPACLGAAKVRFGDPTAAVRGDPGTSACEDAAAATGQNSLDVDLGAIQAGDEYCEFSSDSKMVYLVKVVSITSSPVSVTFSATAWRAPV